MKTTNDDCVGIRGNDKRFGRGETYTYIKEQHQVSAWPEPNKLSFTTPATPVRELY